jgi:hypothetical protein
MSPSCFEGVAIFMKENRSRQGTVGIATTEGCPTSPISCEAQWGSATFMRLSLKKGAHAVLSSAACRKFGTSRSWQGKIQRVKSFVPYQS